MKPILILFLFAASVLVADQKPVEPKPDPDNRQLHAERFEEFPKELRGASISSTSWGDPWHRVEYPPLVPSKGIGLEDDFIDRHGEKMLIVIFFYTILIVALHSGLVVYGLYITWKTGGFR